MTGIHIYENAYLVNGDMKVVRKKCGQEIMVQHVIQADLLNKNGGLSYLPGPEAAKICTATCLHRYQTCRRPDLGQRSGREEKNQPTDVLGHSSRRAAPSEEAYKMGTIDYTPAECCTRSARIPAPQSTGS